MADVDFSHAVLDVFQGNATVNPRNPFPYSYFYLNNGSLTNTSAGMVSSGSARIITDTPSKVSILYTGTFSASGTEFLIACAWESGGWYASWIVSNISFSNGDAYSFIVDVETSGNT